MRRLRFAAAPALRNIVEARNGVVRILLTTEEFVQHDMDARPLFNRYEIPIADLRLHLSRLRALPEVAQLAATSAQRYLSDAFQEFQREAPAEFGIVAPQVRSGLIASGDRFVASADAAEQLRRELPDALCVEMEGAAVAQVCWEHDIPLAVVRVISDKADHSAQWDFPKFVGTVASRFTAGVVRELIRRL